MPYAHTKKKIPPELDRRIKLTEEERETIRALYKEKMPIRAIAKEYPQISRRLIQFIVDPERAERNKKNNKQWQKENGNIFQRIGREKWAEIQREHRRYKQSIKNKLI